MFGKLTKNIQFMAFTRPRTLSDMLTIRQDSFSAMSITG